MIGRQFGLSEREPDAELNTNQNEEKRFVQSLLSSVGGRRRSFSRNLRNRRRQLKNRPILVVDQMTATIAISLVVFIVSV